VKGELLPASLIELTPGGTILVVWSFRGHSARSTVKITVIAHGVARREYPMQGGKGGECGVSRVAMAIRDIFLLFTLVASCHLVAHPVGNTAILDKSQVNKAAKFYLNYWFLAKFHK
jgi:hypothetical protein